MAMVSRDAEGITIGDDVDAERAMLADSLESVAPDAETACGAWTAFDLAAHVVAADRVAGALAFGVRALAARGVHLHPKPQFVEGIIRRERRFTSPEQFRRWSGITPSDCPPPGSCCVPTRIMSGHSGLPISPSPS
ncbi:maleylpyruvate isomerase N-terminal domain-containing protein [Mycobacterium hippophais]|uniref:maleylpyruvate isomerase N-terminal domain-containing protein n=1 Tax=Mycobacterium hippophais TaxID=3016340 RepID=UPI0038CDAA5E